jgi:uncharacterized protein
LWLCLAAALTAGLAFPFDFSGLKPEGYVSDYSRALDPGSRSELERYCAALETGTGVQLAVVTLPTLHGEPIEDVANDLFRKWGIGRKGKDEGLLLLLATGDRKFRLEVGYGLEPILPDGYAGSVLRAMRPSLREGRYGEALQDGVREIGSRIAQAKGVALPGGTPARPPRREHSGPPVFLFLGAFAAFWLLASLMGGGRGRRAYRGGHGLGGVLPALILGNMMGRSMGHRSGGGGFGGFDSGDSFGGFGGGDSGGGGASSSW